MTKEEIIKLIKEKQLQVQILNKEIVELKNLYFKEKADIKLKMTDEQKIELFASYFRGRDDVYPYLSIDKNNPNIKYYIPSCKNEWKAGICNKTMRRHCKTCQYRENKPIDLNVLRNHLFNNYTIGIYPLLEDDTCYLLALDFDDKKDENHIKEDVLAFAKICDDFNVPMVVERSRSGKGFHCWIFFKEKVKAVTARKLGSLLLSKTMEIRDNLKINSFDRMFPSQDYMPKGGYGNLIALPLQTEPFKYGNSAFIDRNFIPYKHPFEYLKSIRKLSENEIFELIKELANTTIDIGHENYNFNEDVKNRNKNNFKYPDFINVVLNNMVCIDKANLSACVKNSFRRLATFANPEFYKRQRMRLSVYNVPLIIDCSKENEKYLMLPRGTLEYLKILCSENNIELKIKDERNTGTKINLIFNGKLRDEQEKAFNKLIEYENGILCAPPSFGKTVIGCKLIEERKVNTLVLVNKLQLLNQWKERLQDFLNIDDVGEISSKKTHITNVVDVASIKSLWNNGNPLDILNNYGMIIIDECHHTAAFTFEQSINTGNAKYVYGISATPERENGHTPIIKMQCGDIRYKVDNLKFNKDLKIPMKVIVRNTHLNFTNPNIDNYELNEINDLIAKDIIRTESIIKDIKIEFDKGKNILILTERLELLDYIYNKLSKYSSNIFKYQGGMSNKILKEYSELHNKIKENGENKIIVATGSCIGEGFDDSSLDVLFITMPISGETRVTQYAGRLHRKNDKKKEIIIYDYVDDNFPKTRNMFLKRKKIYEKMGYEIIDS